MGQSAPLAPTDDTLQCSPMCFVEFEDVSYAARALKEMYGHTLNGLVKGGIRLAYSKNPLGIRGPTSAGPASPPAPHSPYFASDMFGAAAAGVASTPTMAQTMQQIQELHLQQLQLQSRQQSQQLVQQKQQQQHYASLNSFNHLHQHANAARRPTSPPPSGSFAPFGN